MRSNQRTICSPHTGAKTAAGTPNRIANVKLKFCTGLPPSQNSGICHLECIRLQALAVTNKHITDCRDSCPVCPEHHTDSAQVPAMDKMHKCFACHLVTAWQSLFHHSSDRSHINVFCNVPICQGMHQVACGHLAKFLMFPTFNLMTTCFSRMPCYPAV